MFWWFVVFAGIALADPPATTNNPGTYTDAQIGVIVCIAMTSGMLLIICVVIIVCHYTMDETVPC